MATLVKNHDWYYAPFYDGARNPQRKRVPLKTRTKREAKKLLRQLEDEYASREYDPWTGYNANQSTIPIDKNATIDEALDYFIEKKSREDWRKNTTVNNSYILKAFARFIGEGDSVKALTILRVNEYLNKDKFAYETKKTHKKRVMGFLNWLHQEKIVRKDFAGVKIYNNDNEQDQSVSYVSPEEIKAIKDTIRGKVQSDIEQGYQTEKRNALWLIDFVDWQWYSGMRISESLNLYPDDINTDSWEVKIGSDTFSTKTKSKQILPISLVIAFVALIILYKQLVSWSDFLSFLVGFATELLGIAVTFFFIDSIIRHAKDREDVESMSWTLLHNIDYIGWVWLGVKEYLM